MKLLLICLVLAACFVSSATASTSSKVYYTFVSEYGMNAKLEQTKYNFASCSGLRRYGSQSLNTAQWGWVRGYRRFECMYTTDYKTCYHAQYEANVVKKNNGRWGNWYPYMLSRGECYSR